MLKVIYVVIEYMDGWVNKKDCKKWEYFFFWILKKVYDVKVIKVEFLIYYID